MSFELFIVYCCLTCLPCVQTNPQTAVIYIYKDTYTYIYMCTVYIYIFMQMILILSTTNQWHFILKLISMYEQQTITIHIIKNDYLIHNNFVESRL